MIRHGLTLWNKERRYLGSTDLSLTEDGKLELVSLWQDRDINFNKLYVSPMRRCIETVATIFPDMSYTVLDELKERDFGIFEGKSYEELENTKEYKTFINSEDREIIGGESRVDLFNRIEDCLNIIVADLSDSNIENIAIVTHGGVIMHMLAKYHIGNGTIYDYSVENGKGYLVKFFPETMEIQVIEQI